jgi:lysophospholipase L1-like esterase
MHRSRLRCRSSAEPDLVTVLIGSNDIVSRKHRRDFAEQLRQATPTAAARIGHRKPIGNFGLGKQINELIAEQAADRGRRVLNNQGDTSLASWKGKLSEDHFHPNDRGYTRLAEDFFHAIQAGS